MFGDSLLAQALWKGTTVTGPASLVGETAESRRSNVRTAAAICRRKLSSGISGKPLL